MRDRVIDFDGFDWDAANIRKAQRHGLSLDDIEQFFAREILVRDDPAHSKVESRFIAVGQTKYFRTAFVSFTMRAKGEAKLIRVISARFMHKREYEFYEKLKKKREKNG